jgi:hypothetical protein
VTNEKILTKTAELLGSKGTLLYLTKFGSHLYGTNSENSDIDVKGLFLPRLEDLVMGDFPKSINFSTGNNGSKNSKEDIDIELWSFQYFMKLLKQAETTALDLYFSWTNEEALIFFDKRLISFFTKDFDRLIESNEIMKCAYVKYAIGQAKKYGIKGSRVGVLKRISEWNGDASGKLGDVAPELLNKFFDKSFFFEKEVGGLKSLVVCGKVHQYTIKTTEFVSRVRCDYERYGERAKLAEANKGIDWKALSHAMRAIFQMEELIQTGKIVFPLISASASILKNIKYGKLPFGLIENLIVDGIEGLDVLIKESKLVGKFDSEYVRQTVKSLYNL